MANADLSAAGRAKNDEFYTQIADIEKECSNYKIHFKEKTIFCNCDDPYESNFFRYFALNFNYLGLKKLIATCYIGSPIANTQLSLFDHESAENKTTKSPHKIEISEMADENAGDFNGLSLVEYILRNRKNALTRLEGDGDFRSSECMEILKEADIIVTNPPFSLFREYVAQLMDYEKKFLIIGSQNAITYKEFFPLVKENKIWIGFNNFDNSRFIMPQHYNVLSSKYAYEENGIKYGRVSGLRWFTNLDILKRHEKMQLYKKYSPEEYPRYDNYDAIEVGKTAEIPDDWDGIMGVPITFLDKYNPDQFDIMGLTSGRDEFEARPIKKYINPLQINPNNTTTNGSKANTRSTILLRKKPVGRVYYTADNAEGPLEIMYARILIKRK